MEQSEAVEIANSIGCLLARDAVWHKARCNWLGPQNDVFFNNILPAHGMLGPNLYDGTAGVGLFLGQLASFIGDSVMKETALGAIRHALSRIDDVPTRMPYGLFTGHVGIAYAALVIGSLFQHEEVWSGGRNLMLSTLHRDIDGACILDVMFGFAGAIPALLAVRGLLDLDDIEPLLHWGDALVAAAEICERGISWDTTAEMRRSLNATGPTWLEGAEQRRPNLLGLAHGAGGIALSLLELAISTGESRFRRIAEQAFDYEDSWFDSEHMRWPDLRHDGDSEENPTYVAWCHGAVGIGLTRIRAWELTGQEKYREQALMAMKMTADTLVEQLRPETNFCLCHGIAGNAELFLNENVGFGEAGVRLMDDVLRFGRDTYYLPCRPWPYGEPGYRMPVGLMTGLAGTGYFYLRAAAPDVIRSILLLRA